MHVSSSSSDRHWLAPLNLLFSILRTKDFLVTLTDRLSDQFSTLPDISFQFSLAWQTTSRTYPERFLAQDLLGLVQPRGLLHLSGDPIPFIVVLHVATRLCLGYLAGVLVRHCLVNRQSLRRVLQKGQSAFRRCLWGLSESFERSGFAIEERIGVLQTFDTKPIGKLQAGSYVQTFRERSKRKEQNGGRADHGKANGFLSKRPREANRCKDVRNRQSNCHDMSRDKQSTASRLKAFVSGAT